MDVAFQVSSVLNNVYALTDVKEHDTLEKQYEFRKKYILADKSLTKEVSSSTINILVRERDCDKVLLNEGTRRICENCQNHCLAESYCELCIRKYLEANFPN